MASLTIAAHIVGAYLVISGILATIFTLPLYFTITGMSALISLNNIYFQVLFIPFFLIFWIGQWIAGTPPDIGTWNIPANMTTCGSGLICLPSSIYVDGVAALTLAMVATIVVGAALLLYDR
jgi:hypothetical protein